MDYLKKARRASPEIMMQAERYINVGYQKILTFEDQGGGFTWWGHGEPLVWLTAYGVQQLTATAKVLEIDSGVIERAYGFLSRTQREDGAWAVVGDTHTETISGEENASLALTAYVAWSLAEAGYRDREEVIEAISYLKKERGKAAGNPYLLSLMANAFVFAGADRETTEDIFAELEKLKKDSGSVVFWEYSGQTNTYAHGDAANVETTAMAAYAMTKADAHVTTLNRALAYLVQKKQGSGTWGSTQATILALKALVAVEAEKPATADAQIQISINGERAGNWTIDESNRDIMHQLDLENQTRTGINEIRLDVRGNPNMLYQVVGRYFEPWTKAAAEVKPIEIAVTYDRQRLSVDDTVTATATMRYNGEKPTFMVILDLGIPPGFTVDVSAFGELEAQKKIERYSVTSRQITLYLGNVNAGDLFTCRYSLRAKYPLRARVSQSTAYEYYAPEVKAQSEPAELIVEEKP